MNKFLKTVVFKLNSSILLSLNEYVLLLISSYVNSDVEFWLFVNLIDEMLKLICSATRLIIYSWSGGLINDISEMFEDFSQVSRLVIPFDTACVCAVISSGAE